MKKNKIMSGMALLTSATLLIGTIEWSALEILAEKTPNTVEADYLYNGVDDNTTYIGNISGYPLSQIVLKDAYLLNAQTKDIEYLLSLDSDKLLAGFRETAGLDMKGATRYAGWENSLIGGHTMGHYLTAMAQAVAALPDGDANKAKVIEKLNYIVDELAKCQEATGTGYIFGATLVDKTNVEKQFDHVEAGQANITTQAWVPWYTMHKILAGLVDVYSYTNNEKALKVAKNLGTWVYNRTESWDAAKRSRVIAIEYGGMNDCLYQLYAVTGEEKYAVAAHAFDEDTLFKAVDNGNDNVLTNKHANTTIPKFLGALNRYVTTHGKTINGETVDAGEYLKYAEKFFDMVTEKHSYIIGDNSEWEHFGSDNVLDAERTNCNCETCNAYNMLKLAKTLYMITGNAKYAEFYENTFYNTILSSQNPETGMTTYFQPMASGYFKVYGSETGSFWCCTGSGMENFTKLGNALYYKTNEMIIVSNYFSSELNDKDNNVKIIQEANIPESDTVKFKVLTIDGSQAISKKIAFRLPAWLADEPVLKVNGSEVTVTKSSGYAIVEGLKSGDEIEVTLPMNVRAYNLPDGENVYAFKYGPVVLSAKLGTTDMQTSVTGVNVKIPAAKLIEEKYISDGSENISVIEGSVADYIKNINDNLVKSEDELAWTLENTDANLTFVPHYSQHTERYGIYFNYDSNTGAVNASKYVGTKAQERFEHALFDTVQPGYGQYENDELHNMQEDGNKSTGATDDGTTRFANAGGSFTYTMKVAKGEDNYLQVTFRKEDNDKTIKISAGKVVVYEETLKYEGDEESYTVRIPIKASDVDAQAYEKQVTDGTFDVVDIKIESADGNDSARICDYMYTTKAYSSDATAKITSSVGELVEKDGVYILEADVSTENVQLTITPSDTYGYVRVNDMVIKETVPYEVDLSHSNMVNLEITVYAEDHETTKEYQVQIKKQVDLLGRADVDTDLVYFVDCGDYDVTTLSEEDLFGICNGVTEQAYGLDPVTGYQWGIVDTLSNPLKNGTVTNNPAMSNTVFTDNTWPFETDAAIKDGSAKTATNRYTKNQFENGIARNLNYEFELPNGTYEVELYFTDPWGCSKNPIISAEDTKLLESVQVNSAVTASVPVNDGALNLNITAPDATLCLNLAYIKVYRPDTLTPEDFVKNSDGNTEQENDTTAENADDNNTNTEDDKDNSNMLIYGGIIAIVIIAVLGCVVIVRKKKK